MFYNMSQKCLPLLLAVKTSTQMLQTISWLQVFQINKLKIKQTHVVIFEFSVRSNNMNLPLSFHLLFSWPLFNIIQYNYDFKSHKTQVDHTAAVNTLNNNITSLLSSTNLLFHHAVISWLKYIFCCPNLFKFYKTTNQHRSWTIAWFYEKRR